LTSAAVLVAQADRAAAGSEAVIERCDIASVQDLLLPAADAGVLMSLDAPAGTFVKKGAPLATIDDSEVKELYKRTQFEYLIAKQKADSNVDEENAANGEELAKIARDKYDYIRRTDKKAVAELDYLKYLYEWEKAKLVIRKTKEEREQARLTAESKKTEADAARVVLERRRLVAPFDGVVVKTFAQEREWVQAGDPVVQFVRIDRLRVYGNLDATKWTRGDIDGRKVTVEVALPRGRTKNVEGKVVFVSPVVGVESQTPVWAEIDAPMENGQPLVTAGMIARMTIHTNQPAAPAAKSAAPAAKAAPPVPTPVRTTSKR
jgi:multidrug efflux pump subunit AcrA (membrane-fusion protein)